MLDSLKDLLSHTTGMDFDIIKITADDGITSINAVTEDKKLIMNGDFKNEIAEFNGVFGLTKLDTLSKIVNMYNQSTDTVVVKSDFRKAPMPLLDDDGNNVMDQYGNPIIEQVEANVVESITFSRKSPKMKNNYRVVSSAMIPTQPSLQRAIDYDITVEPTMAAIDIIKQQASLGVCETFQFEVEENSNGTHKLVIVFGDTEREAEVDFVAELDSIGGWTGKHGWRWSINTALSVFQYARNADLKIAISSKGIIKVTVNTGLAEYNYLMPALTA